ncbi:hypothetical protein [Bacillus sp. Marseille-P3800]|uniref:hypothetical protein n=1 Tax=Bacillus sp. Marseille-P3800 TaxID=2014782 RepID=UPI00159BBE29|nr:hypothetical protein [Bacillus sp. Marseille-P3800]
MFTLIDLGRLIMSALVILPIVTVIRESGYYLTAVLLGASNKNLVVGSGPKLFSLKTIEVRRYFFMFSWMEYDEVNPKNRFWHGLIYASPILSCMIVAIIINSLLSASILPENMFWSTFMFYVFYFVFFDIIPVYLPDGQPTNGRAIFDLIWHGERSDYLKQEEEKDEERSYTDSQEETMKNRDKDRQERDDHSNPNKDDNEKSYTKEQEETMENSSEKEEDFSDHTRKDG